MISDRHELEASLQADLWYSSQLTSWRPTYYLMRRALYYQRVLRHAEYWEAQGGRLVGRSMLALYKVRLARLGERVGISIPRGTCGSGLSISHPGTIVVNGDARVGARCRLSQGVTIGATPAGAPTVGNDVFFGPHSQVVGAVTVGDGAVILPGAVVTRNVPAKATVGGVPAKVTRIDSEPWHASLPPIPLRDVGVRADKCRSRRRVLLSFSELLSVRAHTVLDRSRAFALAKPPGASDRKGPEQASEPFDPTQGRPEVPVRNRR